MIRVFATDVTPLDIEEGLRFVSPLRRRKASAYLNERDRQLSLGAELLLNYGLQKISPQTPRPAETIADVHGKPRLTGSPLHFNLSHSGAYAVCAICDRPVGVDVEQEVEMGLEIARKFFHPDEYRRIAASPNPTSCFYKQWVLKESYMKAVGLGFGRALNSFCMDLDGGSAQVTENGLILPFVFASWLLDDHHLSVCCASHASLTLDVLEVVDMRECISRIQ